jgi:hypothetical protein
VGRWLFGIVLILAAVAVAIFFIVGGRVHVNLDRGEFDIEAPNDDEVPDVDVDVNR